MKDKIVKGIAQNHIVVISGDTGCGKTTQVPQLVLDHHILADRSSQINMIVTQPRRISALGVSERMASERHEAVGETCGYSIRLQSLRGPKTRILLCTTGILLWRLQCDPDLASVTHVFVDEVHKRDLQTDFLLIILQDLLRRWKGVKLVLMSATVNAELFSNFFGGCPTLQIPGRAHPVTEHRLEEVLQATGYKVPPKSGYVLKKPQFTPAEMKWAYPDRPEEVINYPLLGDLLKYIAHTQEEGAVLVFLPGMMEVTKAVEDLRQQDFFRDENTTVIYPLHSEQTAVFDVPPQGVRKIVLATNVSTKSCRACSCRDLTSCPVAFSPTLRHRLQRRPSRSKVRPLVALRCGATASTSSQHTPRLSLLSNRCGICRQYWPCQGKSTGRNQPDADSGGMLGQQGVVQTTKGTGGTCQTRHMLPHVLEVSPFAPPGEGRRRGASRTAATASARRRPSPPGPPPSLQHIVG
uniref:Helicase ATP-binding domain-containing protein n=1 Tax=Corethron hystrix TaxID=216773 RepID=A0A6U5HS71_9STRA|mmetsp:Transcript_31462/g.72017  ORF Transcript_31462/g.72017 Transcript_31462/m.72017 type:complete len:467 (+) Transcript_31462:365-1765(+)